MTIEFHDGYTSQGFWFGEQIPSASIAFRAPARKGAIASPDFAVRSRFVRYRVRPRLHRAAEVLILREHVRTLDHDARLPDRPPYGRSIALKRGVGSDLQAFGYEAAVKDDPVNPAGMVPGIFSARTCSWSDSTLDLLP